MQPDSALLPANPNQLDPDQVVISVNPKAGGRSGRARVKRLLALLTDHGLRPSVFTDLAAAAEEANRQHAAGRLRALVGAGGDGTAAELVNRTPPGTPLTLFPLGNENLLARYLGLDATPQNLCQTIADHSVIRLDAGKANDRVFLLMIGCGFDAEVVRRLHQRRTGPVRRLSYLKPILASIRSYHYPELLVHWTNDLSRTTEVTMPAIAARWLFAFNLPCYGAGLQLAPEACATDGQLDVCAFRHGSLWHGLRYVGAVLRRQHQILDDCTTCRIRRLRITSTSPIPYQLDGDPGGLLPVDVEVLPNRLSLVVPTARARQLIPSPAPEPSP